MSDGSKFSLRFALITMVIILGVTTPFSVREPTAGHILFEVLLVIGGGVVVFLVALIASTLRGKRRQNQG